MKVFPEKMKQSTKYILLIFGSFGIAAYGMSLDNNIILSIISFSLFISGFIGLVAEIIKWLKKKTKRN